MNGTAIQFDLSEKDVMRLFEHHLRTSPANRRVRLATCSLSGIVAGWYGYFSGSGWWAFGWVALGFLVPLCLYRWGGPAFNRVVWRRQLREGSGLTGPRTLRIDDAGVHGTSPQGEGITRWSAIHRIDEDGEYAYLLMTLAGIVIPKRAFATDDAATAFIERARAWQKAPSAAER